MVEHCEPKFWNLCFLFDKSPFVLINTCSVVLFPYWQFEKYQPLFWETKESC